MHQREQPDEASGRETKSVTVPEEQVAVGAPAHDRKTEAIVQRATLGLMKRDSRRRVRVFVHRILFWGVIALLLAAAWHFFGSLLPMDLLTDWWADIESKLTPVFWSGGE